MRSGSTNFAMYVDPTGYVYIVLLSAHCVLLVSFQFKCLCDPIDDQVGEDPVSTNYSCSASLDSIVRTIYELGNYSTMSDDDIKEWVLDNLDDYYYFMNPDVDKYEQVYRIRSFFTSGMVSFQFI